MMVDETADGDLFAALSMREADLEKHLSSGQVRRSERFA
jgi:carboxyl-terminal processing protease